MSRDASPRHLEDLDETDAAVLDQLQSSFPLVERPFAAIAGEVGVPEREVLRRARGYVDGGVVRQLSAIFDTRSLGYGSSLVAARVEPARLEEAAEVISAHPGVSHNYRRDHDFNLWFTVAVPPDSRLGLEGTVELLGREAGAEAIRLLPTLRLFKIGVDLDVSGRRGHGARARAVYSEQDQADSPALDEEERAVVREAQRPMEVLSEPFAGPAAAAGTPPGRFLEVLVRLKEGGQLRRVAAVLRHRKVGFCANAMGVWKVPEERVEEVGRLFGGLRAVSHCYLRPSYPDWPFNVFTMVHGRSRGECEEILASMAREAEIEERSALYSTREFKKTRVSYFTPEIAAWEAARLEPEGVPGGS